MYLLHIVQVLKTNAQNAVETHNINVVTVSNTQKNYI